MPTLIRFVLVLLFLGLLGVGSMVALTVLVEPQEKEVNVRIPARVLLDN